MNYATLLAYLTLLLAVAVGAAAASFFSPSFLHTVVVFVGQESAQKQEGGQTQVKCFMLMVKYILSSALWVLVGVITVKHNYRTWSKCA